MSRFDQQFATLARPGLLEQFGDEVIYSPLAGPPVAIQAIAGAERGQQEGLIERRTRDFQLSRADAPAPARGDSLVIDGQTWIVDEVRTLTPSFATLSAGRVDPTEWTHFVTVIRNEPTPGDHGDQEINELDDDYPILCRIAPQSEESVEDEMLSRGERRCVIFMDQRDDLITTDRLRDDAGNLYLIESFDWPELPSQPLRVTALLTSFQQSE